MSSLLRLQFHTAHIDQGCYTYRHDSILNFIVSRIDGSKYTEYSDTSGYQASNGGTIPVKMRVPELKPDLVIVNSIEKTVAIFELTVPFEGNIKATKTYINKQICTLFEQFNISQNNSHCL